MATSNVSDSYNSPSQSQISKSRAWANKQKKFRSYNFLFLIMAFMPMASVALFNWAIDPYDLFNTPNWWGVNHEKIKKDNNDRLFKAVDIIRLQPKTILMGSSRTKQGLDPEHPAINNNRLAYNLAINGPNTYEVRRYIEHAIANQPDLQQIILGIDFFMFNSSLDNQPSFEEKRIEKKHIILSDAINALFSLDTLDISRKTIAASFKTEEQNNLYGENGFMPNRKADDGATKWRFEQSIQLYFNLHSDYQFSQEYWSDFVKIVELCRQNNIDLKVFISPAHATQWESIEVTGRWDTFEQWKRELVKVTPVWDFSGFNSVTTEAIKAKMNNYVDNSHYSPAIGNLILNRIFDYKPEDIPQDFGILLTTENIEQHLAKIRSDRLVWTKNHPEEVKLVRDIKKKLNRQKKAN